MRVALIAYNGFNELDVFANFYLLNRLQRVVPSARIDAFLVLPEPAAQSMYQVRVEAQRSLAFVREADAVVITSGGILAALEDPDFLGALMLDRERQLIGSQCSGALVLAKLGLLADQPACTDSLYRDRLIAAGVQVLLQPFHARDNVATAGGCFASAHLATWLITQLVGKPAAEALLTSVAPVGEEHAFVKRVLDALEPYL
jgi:transcriptional regulator GlxA family with amidase domain